jgi:hypothetical protein
MCALWAGGPVQRRHCLLTRRRALHCSQLVRTATAVRVSGMRVFARGPTPVSSTMMLSGSRPNRSTLGCGSPCMPRGRCGTGRKCTATSILFRPRASPVRSRNIVVPVPVVQWPAHLDAGPPRPTTHRPDLDGRRWRRSAHPAAGRRTSGSGSHGSLTGPERPSLGVIDGRKNVG